MANKWIYTFCGLPSELESARPQVGENKSLQTFSLERLDARKSGQPGWSWQYILLNELAYRRLNPITAPVEKDKIAVFGGYDVGKF